MVSLIELVTQAGQLFYFILTVAFCDLFSANKLFSETKQLRKV
jgi:hypothetical protein